MRPPRFGIRALAAAVALVALACLAPVAPCAASERERDEPRLILPGARAVEPGEWIVLQWTPADSVRELELLLSTDGGHTWPLCISPSLDPDRCAFRWQVPVTAARNLRLRIRFNRGGREIEGAPSAPLLVTVGDRSQPLPLGLPPVAPAPARAPGNDARETSSLATRTARLDPPSTAPQPPGPADERPAAIAAPGATPLDAGPKRVPMRT